MAAGLCKRCGKCCAMGTLWTQSPHPLIARVARAMFSRGAQGSDGSPSDPCDMLVMDGETAICLIHKYLGADAKPDVCQDYPAWEDGCMGRPAPGAPAATERSTPDA